MDVTCASRIPNSLAESRIEATFACRLFLTYAVSGTTRSEAEIGSSFSRTIEDQQLVLDEHGLGRHGPRAARAGQSDDRHQQVQKRTADRAGPNRIKVAKS